MEWLASSIEFKFKIEEIPEKYTLNPIDLYN